MKYLWILVLSIGPITLAQDAPRTWPSKTETTVNFTITAADMAQTCYHLASNPRWHEEFTPSQNCAAISAMNFGRATAALLIDRYLLRHHPRLAHFQSISAGMSGFGIAYTFTR